MFKILNVSVPMPILLPAEIIVGISDTNISVVKPAAGAPVIVESVATEKVVTPTLNVPFNSDKSVDKPDIFTKSFVC